MSTKKFKNDLINILGKTGLLGTALMAGKAMAGGGEAGGSSGSGSADGTTSYSDDSISDAIGAAIGTYSVPGTYDAYDAATGDYLGSVEIGDIPSTPFLAVWSGKKYVHENDFLFGKPNTVFTNYKIGLKNYQAGIGGDTYLLSSALQADKNGLLKMQIRELEPEESYIDKFEIGALDLKEHEHFVVDGNLEDSYVFDTQKTKIMSREMHHYHSKADTFTSVEGAYTDLVPKEGQGITMQTNDELIIRVPKAQLDPTQDTFVLVDSHYRDWSLGNQVPFSRLENFMIQSISLGRSSTTALAGVALLASVAFVGINKSESSTLAKLLSVPHSYAEYVVGSPTRSLVISAGDSFGQTYLQTLFPRYVRAAQEVVRVPREVIARLQDDFLTLRIKATKKHKVRTAFVFQGAASAPEVKTLPVQQVINSKTGTDHTEQIKEKNSVFLHTIPGDVLDVVIQDLPKVANTTRRYVLRANGFYTRLSAKTSSKIGTDWLESLAHEDRNLLKDLRLS